MVRYGIIGHGAVGRGLDELAQGTGWEPMFYANSQGFYRDSHHQEKVKSNQIQRIKEQCHIIFLAMASSDDGTTALHHINGSAGYAPVITCEKRALANHWRNLAELIKQERIRYSAAVGGGTGMLQWAERELGKNRLVSAHAVVNGTLNLGSVCMYDKWSEKRILKEYTRRGCAEPGASSFLEVWRGEHGCDVPAKAAIIYNTLVKPKRFVCAKDIQVQNLTAADITQVREEIADRVYVLSILPEKPDMSDVIGGWFHKAGRYWLTAGWFELNGDIERLQLKGLDNAMRIVTKETASMSIPGAGAGIYATAERMMLDAEEVLSTPK